MTTFPVAERRQNRRLTADAHGITSIRIRPGHAARIVDASAAGALIETKHRLLPGAPVELHMETRAQQCRVRARVVRCAVVQVRASTVFYRGAVAFERHLPWFAGGDGYVGHVVPPVEQRGGRAHRADVTREVE